MKHRKIYLFCVQNQDFQFLFQIFSIHFAQPQGHDPPSPVRGHLFRDLEISADFFYLFRLCQTTDPPPVVDTFFSQTHLSNDTKFLTQSAKQRIGFSTFFVAYGAPFCQKLKVMVSPS